MPATRPTHGSQAVDRALSILWLFDDQTERLTVSQAAARLGVHRSTASRLMARLARHRLLEIDQASGGYMLGLGLVSLAGHVLSRFPVRDGAREIARRLRDETEANVYLGVLNGDEVVYIDQVSSPHVRLSVDWVGRRQRLAAGVTGAVLLAFQAPHVIRELLREAQAEADPSAPRLDQDLLRRARELGYLARYEDPVDDHAVVAAPIRDRRADVVAALCVAVIRHRIDEARFADHLIPAAVGAAARISESLGYAQR